MTKVVERNWHHLVGSCVLAISMIPLVWAQNAAPAAAPSTAAQDLYQQLRTVGLDKSRVYRVRDLSLNRAAVHITLEDGTIAFTEDVIGRVTGAFFEGDGEVLLVPPDQVERSSMALFTGAAILEEKFGTAYFRFSDDTYTEMQPQLRPAENQAEFVTQWNETARNLADTDALRLLVSFSRLLPVTGSRSPVAPAAISEHMLHARLQGQKLGTFDIYYDDRSPESVGAGQLKTNQGQSFYDVWTSFSFAEGAPLSKTRTERVPDPEIDVSQYTIKAEVRPPTTVSVDASLQMEVHRSGARAVLFELSRFLQVKQVEVDGHPVEFIHNQALEGTQLARRGNDVVAVVFPQPLVAGEKMRLRFTYGGDVLSEAGGGLLYVGARGTWYPNQGIAMANFDMEFRYPPGWTLIATGKHADPVPAKPPTENPAAIAPLPEQVSRWVSERPIPVAGFNLGRYERANAKAGDITVESYAAGVERGFPKGSELVLPSLPKTFPLPEEQTAVSVETATPTPARNAQAVADRSAQAVDFFARRFGPYPYGDLALTQMPGDLSQGWPGLIFLSSFSFLTPHEKAQLHLSPVSTILSNSVIAHETAHQWWGDLVSWRGYRDQWISEALANYSALMLLETEDPDQFRMVMDKYRDDLLEKNKDNVALMDAGPVTLGIRLSCSRLPNGYEAISYGRGTWLFHMLRNMFRDSENKPSATNKSDAFDEPFLRTLRSVRERFAGKTMSTEDLLHAFEDDLPPSLWYEGKKSLDWFYQGWVNGTAVPRFGLQNVKYVPKGSATAVTGTILQKDAPTGLVSSIPVYASGIGKTPLLLGRVFADGPETPFHVTAPAGTRKILLDPFQTVLSRSR